MDKPALHIERIVRIVLKEEEEEPRKINLKKYPFTIPVIKKFKKIEFKKPVTFIIGENGTGKSTLLEAFAVACGFNPEGGPRHLYFSTKESHSTLYNYLRVEAAKSFNYSTDGFFLRAESFYNVATAIEEMGSGALKGNLIRYYGEKSFHKQSHGESFLTLITDRLFGNGIYIFDEPEAAFSPMKLLELLVVIDDLVKNNSQFIISTHSPILMAYPNADIYEIVDGKLQSTEYEDTQHFQMTKYFLMNRNKMLGDLGIKTADG
jgi:predicted ATPase